MTELQRALNLAPTTQPRLEPDGDFGPKTHGRVMEFQTQNRITRDGVVGPETWGVLAKWIDQLVGAILNQPGIRPEDEAKARERVLHVARNTLRVWGGKWTKADVPSPKYPKIAGKICADPQTRYRQGGSQIAFIFSGAGHPDTGKCLRISPDAVKMYESNDTSRRNSLDIVSWCGIFALYCYRMSGLKLSPWPLRYGDSFPAEQHEWEVIRYPDKPQPGDIGIKSPRGLNHHFIVNRVDRWMIESIDGNAGNFMELIEGRYTTTEVTNSGGYFIRPIWSRVLAK